MSKLNKENNLDKVTEAISEWIHANKGNVTFIGHFITFDPKAKKDKDFIKDDGVRLIAYGYKDMLKNELKCLAEELKDEKGDFVNW